VKTSTAFRAWLNRLRRRWWHLWAYRMVFGERSGGADPQLRRFTRISPAACIEHPEHLSLGDHVYVGPFNFLECSGGISLGEGVQITSHCSLVTHSSHRALRLLGEGYTEWPGHLGARPGWIAGLIRIGAYSFVGPHSLIEANTTLGKGTLVCAGSFVRGDYPDFAILEGRPARIVGDTRRADERLLQRYPDLAPLREAWAGRLNDAGAR
jgi:acetyltransferase-like isoleucine patch superfamily enzyme